MGRGEKIFRALRLALVILAWGAVIALFWHYRASLTPEAIAAYAPRNLAAAAGVMLALFAVKGLLFTFYGGILYAASGILFPLPAAILINTFGTVLMIGVPFFIGRKAGASLVARLSQNKKIARLREMNLQNQLFISFLVRLVGLLPADLVAMYLGALGFRSGRYFAGSLLGLFPSIVLFSVMGMAAHDRRSPVFWICLAIQLGTSALSITLFSLWQRHKKKKEASFAAGE